MLRSAIAALAVLLIGFAIWPDAQPVRTAEAQYLMVPGDCPGGFCPEPTVSSYQPRWQNHDGLTKAQHAEQYHGIDTSGMSATQVAMALDADHDANGPGHPAVSRSVSYVSYPSVSSSVSYGSTGTAAVSYGSTGSTAYTSSRNYVRGQPLRNVVRSQPLRSVLRRVFCRR